MKARSFKVITILLVVAILLVGWVTIFGKKGWLAYRHLLQTKVQMEERISALEVENRRMSHEVYRLEHDKDYQERVVRQQLDVGKPDELVFKFKSHH